MQIFVGGLDADVTEEDLMQPFSQFGEVVSVKIPVGKGCGFVQFGNRYEHVLCLSAYSSSSVGLVLFNRDVTLVFRQAEC